jgi:segregation and condensation protein A
MERSPADPVAGAPDWDDWESPVRVPAIPMLHLDGFDGPMDLLLDLAERQRIDWGRMSILALAEQFVAALDRLADCVAIERRADWLVMATRLLLLRSRLLFPESPMAAEAAQRDAASELRRLDDLAAWLGDRPVLGQDVFARGAPDRLGVYREAHDEVDVIAFLWASLSLFEDDTGGLDTVARYRPAWTDLYSVTEARDRILRILRAGGDGQALEHFLPQQAAPPANGDRPEDPLRLFSAWASTFSASLELARLGDVALAQTDAFASIHVSCVTEPGP